MAIMAVVGLMFLVGVVLTVRWTSWTAAPATSVAPRAVPPVADVARWYARGAAVVLVAGFWAGLLVTGPAIRLVMRLLGATASDAAQGRLTEADEVIGEVTFGGTVGLIVFGGLLVGLASAALWALTRRFFPVGPLGGLAFGTLHLLVFATRLDPLRPGNRDFELVGPGWLSVALYAATCVLHGMAIAAFASRYRRLLDERAPGRRGGWTVVAPLVVPGLFALATVAAPVALLVGAVVAVTASRSGALMRLVSSRRVLRAGQVGLAAFAVLYGPGAISDLADIVGRSTL